MDLESKCSWGNVAGVEELLRSRQFAHADLHAALCETARKGHLQVLQVLLDAGAPAGAQTPAGMTALHFAAQEGEEDACRLLVRHLPDRGSCEQRNSRGLTAADLARERDLCGVARRLEQCIQQQFAGV